MFFFRNTYSTYIYFWPNYCYFFNLFQNRSFYLFYLNENQELIINPTNKSNFWVSNIFSFFFNFGDFIIPSRFVVVVYYYLSYSCYTQILCFYTFVD